MVTFASYVSAQESGEATDTTMTSETVVEESGSEESPVMEEGTTTSGESEEVMTDEVMTSDEDSMTNELSDEEISEIIENSEELSESDIEETDDLEGEVIAVTDEVVVIEQPSGETIVVDKEVYSGKTGGRIIGIGSKIETGSVDLTTDTPTVTTNSGTYTITSTTPIKKAGVSVKVEDIQANDEVVAVLDHEGNLVALEIDSDLDGSSASTWFWIIVGVIVIGILGKIFCCKGEEKDEVENQ